MANWYVYSGAAGTASGADWTNATTTIAAAISVASAGDTYYVAHDHAESQATALSLAIKGTAAAPDFFYCVSRAGSVPPVAADLRTTATVTTTGANALALGSGAGSPHCYFYGITFACGSGAGAMAISIALTYGILENCALQKNGTIPNTSAINIIGKVDLIGTTMKFGSTGDTFRCGAAMRWFNTASAIQGATLPTTLCSTASSTTTTIFDGVDLSALGSGKTLVAGSISNGMVRLVNCQLGSSVTVAGTPTFPNQRVEVIGSDSSSNNKRNESYQYSGALTTETTIKRTAGADFDGDATSDYSWKVVTTANAKRALPFETFEGAIFNTATGSSKTLTFHCVTDNLTLQDADIWVEVEYLGSSSTPLASITSSAPATLLTAGSNLTSDSGEAWTTTGLATPTKQKFSVSFTPQMVGPVRWKVKVAKASTTVYVDPNPDLV